MTLDELAKVLEAESYTPCRYPIEWVPHWRQVAERVKAMMPEQSIHDVSMHRLIETACEAYIGGY